MRCHTEASKQPSMGVNHDVFLGFLLQRNLLVCMTKVKLGEVLSSTELREQVVCFRDWIVIQFRYRVARDAEVTADSNTVFVAFQNSHDRGCPLGNVNQLESTLLLKSLELLLDLGFQSKQNGSGRVKMWNSIGVYIDFGLEAFECAQTLLENGKGNVTAMTGD